MSGAKTYSGGCHCGRVRFEVTTEIDKVYDCNCSFCTKLGALWIHVDAKQFTLKSGERDLRDYQFNKKHIHHLTCGTCGIEAFGRDAEGVGVNARALDGLDLARIPRVPFDGKSL